MRVVSVLAGLLGGSLLAGGLLAGTALAQNCADATPPGDTPAARLICRDSGLAAAAVALDGALAALAETTDAGGRAAIDAAQTLWRARRDEICPVTAADLDDAKAAKARGECLLRLTVARTRAIDAEREARATPVADLPLTITDAAAPRLAAVAPRVAAQTRPVSNTALLGRWAKADPVSRTPIDDCRTSYLDVTRERAVHLVDPRVPGFPVEGRLAGEAAPIQDTDLTADGAVIGTLRLEVAETMRLDRVVLRLAPPATFAATFVRCR